MRDLSKSQSRLTHERPVTSLGLAVLARDVAAASRALPRRLLLLPVGRSGPHDSSILETYGGR